MSEEGLPTSLVDGGIQLVDFPAKVLTVMVGVRNEECSSESTRGEEGGEDG